MAKEFVVDDSKFRSVDITKIAEFVDACPQLISDFNSIKERFQSINSTLLGMWDGEGADEYRFEADSILEKIGDLGNVLYEITEGSLKEIRSAYSDTDEELGAFNRDPSKAQE